jgi:hypothetical protein
MTVLGGGIPELYCCGSSSLTIRVLIEGDDDNLWTSDELAKSNDLSN